nr:hypothetical protein [uncultured Dyadobacter sp.]
MSKFTFFVIALLLALTCCKDDEPKPLSEIADIAGTWHLVEIQYQTEDSTVTKNMDNEKQPIFSIRHDGVMLYDGYSGCCASWEYTINGKLFNVKPLSEVPQSPDCAFVNCWACPRLTITQQGDEMTIESCNKFISKYVRKE